ncbi:hypothetical protein K435DRAFT_778104, partial [Dendrothele bispora CBS 962.96]
MLLQLRLPPHLPISALQIFLVSLTFTNNLCVIFVSFSESDPYSYLSLFPSSRPSPSRPKFRSNSSAFVTFIR